MTRYRCPSLLPSVAASYRRTVVCHTRFGEALTKNAPALLRAARRLARRHRSYTTRPPRPRPPPVRLWRRHTPPHAAQRHPRQDHRRGRRHLPCTYFTPTSIVLRTRLSSSITSGRKVWTLSRRPLLRLHPPVTAIDVTSPSPDRCLDPVLRPRRRHRRHRPLHRTRRREEHIKDLR